MAQVSYAQYFAMKLASTGNTWLLSSQVEQDLKRYGKSLSCLDPLIKDKTIQVAKKEDGTLLLTLAQYKQAEINIVNNIYRILNAPRKTYPADYLNKLIDEIQIEKNAKLDINQRKAVIKAVNSNFMVLTGGPGTGKTFVLSFINAVHKKINPELKIDYAAPTGKAARRITESTGFFASTLHSKLKITKDNFIPERLSPFINILNVDEVSMLDVFVMEALVKAVQTGQTLYLIGDTDQLPSVGPGAILRDLIASGCVPVAQLTKTFRQEGDSILFDNIQRIKRGETHIVAGDDFRIAAVPKGMNPKEILLWMYKKEASEWGIENTMLLTPYRQSGETCSNILNVEIQKACNPTGPGIMKPDGMMLRKGDIVMQTENRTKCANGDVGKVVGVVGSSGLEVKFCDTTVNYNTSNLNDLTLAYAMSIHKSQGSEAKSVVTTLLSEHAAMLQRNLVYTAVTRARCRCSGLFDPDALKKAILTEASCQRITLLKELLQYKFS